MRLKQLAILNFRNIEKIFLNFDGKSFFFLGNNAEGKTNIIEAIYTAFRGKSFRSFSHKNDWVRSGSNETHIQLQIENSMGFVTQVTLANRNSGRWESRLDDKKIAPKLLRERIPVVVFSPEDHAIIRSGPEARREYMDDVFSDICPGYLELQEKFEGALKQRNELLKKLQNKQNIGKAEWDAWDEVFIEKALAFWTLRFELWPEFSRRVDALNSGLFEKWNDKIHANFCLDKERFSKVPSKEEFKKILGVSYEADIATGWTHHGPHRDDVQFFIGKLDSRANASQGQARMLAFALKWLQAQWIFDEQREAPIFLVDDFSSEFDATNRMQLMRLVNSLGSQVFLTGTQASLVDSEAKIEYTQYTVLKGAILVN